MSRAIELTNALNDFVDFGSTIHNRLSVFGHLQNLCIRTGLNSLDGIVASLRNLGFRFPDQRKRHGFTS